MNALSLALLAIVLFLFAMGTASFIALLKGCFYLRRHLRTTPRYDGNILLKSPLVSGVSVVLAVQNADQDSREFAQKLVELHFGKHELVLVLDGPSEEELKSWTDEFHLCLSARGAAEDLETKPIRGIYESRDPLRLVVVDKEPGGFADALNAGVNVAAQPVICMIDPECQFEPTLLLSLIRPMLDDPGRTVAVCGVMPAPVKSQASWATRFGELEALRLWLARCAAFAGWNRLLPVPGSSMLVLRDAIVKTGGLRARPLEFFLNLHGHAGRTGKQYRVAFVPEAVSYALVPGAMPELREHTERQERRFAQLLRGRRTFAGGLTAIGWGLPAILCDRCIRPILETIAYPLALVGWLFGWVDLAMLGLLVLSTVGMGILISMSAVVFHELAEFGGTDPACLAKLFFSAIPENLGYRQMRNLWLIGGFWRPTAKENRGATA